MGTQIIQQPSGLYAVWSSNTDDFDMVDATVEEIIEDRIADYTKEMTERVNKIVEDLKAGKKPYHQFTRTFDECVARIRELHGDDAETLGWLGLGVVK